MPKAICSRPDPQMPAAPVIAIVDDDQAIREALEDYLRSYGYESRLFGSAEDYLTYPDRFEIDCIVSDIKMTGMSGLELQELLLGSPLARPFIFMTSYEDEEIRNRAMGRGAIAFLGKPVPMNELARQIDKALNP